MPAPLGPNLVGARRLVGLVPAGRKWSPHWRYATINTVYSLISLHLHLGAPHGSSLFTTVDLLCSADSPPEGTITTGGRGASSTGMSSSGWNSTRGRMSKPKKVRMNGCLGVAAASDRQQLHQQADIPAQTDKQTDKADRKTDK